MHTHLCQDDGAILLTEQTLGCQGKQKERKEKRKEKTERCVYEPSQIQCFVTMVTIVIHP